MIPDGVLGLPRWLLVGLGLGALSSLAVVGLFVVAERYFDTVSEHWQRHPGETRRRVELRDYLDAIDEQYAEDHFVAGQHVAFYLPKRDVAITFDARAYYRIEATGTDAVLVEHEMPGAMLGDRLPFEVPEVVFGRPEARRTDPIVEAFDELGLPITATVEEVKAAYRHRVKETHPDQGGDEDAFRRVREAYTTAKEHAD